ncbi:exodeoxyribonuclease III [Pantanalinema sp. GBBB05]|uniref:exodeoxyribonuclease III n=1 Tax=Pantanalinema sp. GBBB05 TaxID=2604139 RepID=UPI001D222DD0|nr:exodeoxyribonuclease III [Pantanalinema sp. GBBB05]
MKIATWNVNSIRTRLEHVKNWLIANPIDILCVQETKVIDDLFPQQAFSELGYQLIFSGQKSYNGVAIFSRTVASEVSRGFAPVLGDTFADLDEQKRVITGVFNDIRIVNLYVPNGSAICSDKYAYKLRWFTALQAYLTALLQQSEHVLVCGDFNVAPEDIDIHDPKGREKQVMATDAERLALQQGVIDLGLADVFRKFTSDAGHFSWWDYRTGAFRRNAGWRIDHIYLTPVLYDCAIACEIDRAPRELEQPSDHTPVIVTLGSWQ